MKFTLDARTGVNLISSYGPGEVRIGNQTLHAHCIVTAETLITDWNVSDPMTLSITDFERILALKPELVLLGTGSAQRFPPAGLRKEFSSRRIGFEIMDLGAACRTFNILVQEERNVAAALFLF